MAVDELTYPQPVLDRTGPGPTTAVAQATAGQGVPRTRIFSFQLGANAGRRSTTMFGPLRAPSVIWSLEYTYTNASAPPASCCELGIATTNQQENDVLVATARPYVPIVEQFANALSTIQGNLFGWLNESVGGIGKLMERSVRKVVVTPEWFLAVGYNNNVGLGGNLCGNVVVIEGISESTAQAFP